MNRRQITAAAAYWLTLMVSAYLGSGLTFYLVAIPAIVFGLWQAGGYVRERARKPKQLSLEARVAELHCQVAALDVSHNWVESDWELPDTRNLDDELHVWGRYRHVTEERCTQCKATVKPRDYATKSGPCWAHANYQPTREERECALDVRMCQTRYDAMMQEVETGERGEPCQCWQAVFKDTNNAHQETE